MSAQQLGPDATVGIVGGGLMGFGLAVLFAKSGYRITIFDSSAEVRAGLIDRISAELSALGLESKIVEKITVVDSLQDAVAKAGIVIEAVFENRDLKREIFTRIDAAAPADSILASNTSVIPISQFTEKVSNRERVLGTHFWNPPHLIPLVEVIATSATSEQTMDSTVAFMRSAGKLPVRVAKDVPGFVGNRMQAALHREAIAIVQEGICDAENVDLVVKNSFGLRMPVCGPLETIDLIGADLVCAIQDEVLPSLSDEKQALPYLRDLAENGKLGAKSPSGEGFYKRSHEQHDQLRKRLTQWVREQTK